MPFELNPANGQWEHTGPLPDDSAPVTASPVAIEEAKPKPKKVEAKKPWWQQARDLIGEVVEDMNPAARYVPSPVDAFNSLRKGELPPQIKNLQNDLQFEVNQLTASPQSAIARAGSYALDYTSPLPTDATNTLKLGGAKMSANAIKAVADPIGLGGPTTEGSIDESLDTVYRANGFKPPSEMTEEELGGDDMRASLVLNTMLALATQGASAKLQASALATKFPALAKVLGFADVTKAKTLLGGATRFSFGQLLDELPSTFLDDNTGGSGQQLLGLAVGAVNPETGAAISKSDPAVQPGLSRTESSMAAFGPNLAASFAFGGGLMGLAKALPATQRAISAANTRMRRQASRQALVENNIVVEDEAGKTAFSPKVFETMGELEEALETAAAEQKAAAPIPVADEFVGPVLEKPLQEPLPDDVDPWTMEYDPEILEADAALEVIESQLDDAELDELLARGFSENTAEVLDEISARNTGAPIRDDVAYESSAAPVNAIATSGAMNERFSSVPTDTLRSLANPANSPVLANKIKELTGKDPSTFDRVDVLEGITALEADGRTVMPSRLMGQPTLLTSEIEVDPKRFQFKMGTDDQGQQKGNSLDGVKVWNEDAEGAVQVWTDPMDGKTYVVNGHNRLAKAKELSIPAMKVEYINAPTAEAARAKGALTNIMQGGGTLFDAAKFFRDSGVTDPAQLGELGVPMKSGLAVKGLALAKLPGNIFQDAVDGRLTEMKAVALGGSGLDETGMQQAYKALQSRDMTDSTFHEVLQQAKSAPTVQGDQVDLFGNTDMLNLMVQKGELAARIKKDLGQTRRAANSATKNVQTLEGVGNQINKEGTKSLADDTAALLDEFDANKYMEGPTSQLLNEGAEQIANGARLNVVADRIRRQLIEAAEGTPAPEKAIDPEVLPPEPAGNRKGSITAGLDEVLAASEALDRRMARRTGKFLDKQSKGLADLKETVTRQEKVSAIVKQAARKGEVRPPSTPLPESPAVPEVDVNQRADMATLEILDNEARLMDEFQVIDDALAADQLAAGRANNGYDGMTFEQKKGAGMLDGLAKAEPTPKPTPEFVMPQAYAKSKPTFGRAQLSFESDLDRAAYMLQSKTIGAKADKKREVLFAALEEKGISRREALDLGAEVKAKIQDGIEEVTGSRKAPQERFTIEVPKSERGGFGIQAAKYFHGTDASNVPSIDAKGLKAAEVQLYGPGVYLTSEKGAAKWHRVNKKGGSPNAVYALDVADEDVVRVKPRPSGDAEVEWRKEVVKLREEGKSVLIPGSGKWGDMLIVDESKAKGAKLSASQSVPSPQLSRSGKYNEAKTRKMLENAEAFRASNAEAALLDIGLKLPSQVIGLERISKRLSSEMVDGLKDAARISGLDPLRIQYLDKIEMRKLFGDKDSNKSLERWRPDLARFARENPGDPLIEAADGVTGGVYVPRDYANTHRHMIYLAMGPSLDKRLASPGLTVGAGTPMQRTAYHESFHAVQEWIDEMAGKGDPDAIRLGEAMGSDEAIAEMTKIVKDDKFGNFQEGMDLKELQAEAFATWYNNRKLRLKAGGLQAGFEKIKKFINDLRRRWKKALDKEPGYVDVFELAAAGKIADGGNKAIAKLRPEQLEALKGRIDSNMDAMLPELTDRVQSYLKAKQAEFDVLADKLAVEIDMEGC